ncbi:MAG TPA: LytTR family DNA-binding domain-containing protein [Nitrosopumilaceae archaeon]|jgi:two-component system LytT family response regulator|nr:LytTR family DNA-binding domain-containing protein [Nitrosopumilaceae archaeon]
MIKALIVEDEIKSRELLVSLVKKHCPEITVVDAADGVESGVAAMRKHIPDLLLLDISMPDGTGFDLLGKVQDMKFDVIFTTATDKYALKAIKYSALDYLLKPIDAEELRAAVNKVTEKKSDLKSIENLSFLLQNLKQNNDNYNKISLPTGNAYEIVNIKDIIRCEAEGSYTNFYLVSGKKLMVSASLKHYEDLLPEKDFTRVHHHHLINMNHVVRFLKVDGGYAVMSDNTQVEISRRKKDTFLQKLNGI